MLRTLVKELSFFKKPGLNTEQNNSTVSPKDAEVISLFNHGDESRVVVTVSILQNCLKHFEVVGLDFEVHTQLQRSEEKETLRR